jgi:hypothetical protein
MREQLEMFISFDTPLEDIETLRKEMEAFVRHPDNNRDFQPDIVLECIGLGSMDKLQLKVEIRHKSNWSNETVRAARRSKFMCALVLALRKVPIYCPGGGGVPLGDPGNPSYSVAVSDQIATAARAKADERKKEKRLVHTKSTKSTAHSGAKKSSGVDIAGGVLGTHAEVQASEALHARRPTDTTVESWEEESLEHTDEANFRQTLLNREATRGRRKPGETVPLPRAREERSLTVTQPSSRMRHSFDEEANTGLTMSPVDEGSSLAAGSSYSMFPQSIPQPRDQSIAQQKHLPLTRE